MRGARSDSAGPLRDEIDFHERVTREARDADAGSRRQRILWKVGAIGLVHTCSYTLSSQCYGLLGRQGPMRGALRIICCFGVTYIEMQSWTLLPADIVSC
jgi:hypothetical protein